MIGTFEPADGISIVIDEKDDYRYQHFVFRDGRLVCAILLGGVPRAAAVKAEIEMKLDFSGLPPGNPSASDVVGHAEMVRV